MTRAVFASAQRLATHDSGSPEPPVTWDSLPGTGSGPTTPPLSPSPRPCLELSVGDPTISSPEPLSPARSPARYITARDPAGLVTYHAQTACSRCLSSKKCCDREVPCFHCAMSGRPCEARYSPRPLAVPPGEIDSLLGSMVAPPVAPWPRRGRPPGRGNCTVEKTERQYQRQRPYQLHTWRLSRRETLPCRETFPCPGSAPAPAPPPLAPPPTPPSTPADAPTFAVTTPRLRCLEPPLSAVELIATLCPQPLYPPPCSGVPLASVLRQWERAAGL